LKKLLVFIPPLMMLISIIIMAMPNAIKLTSKDLEGIYYNYFSFFSIDAFLMGSFIPLVLALLSIANFLVLMTNVLKPDFNLKRHTAINTIFAFIIILSIISLLILEMWTKLSVFVILLIISSTVIYNVRVKTD